MKTKLLIVAVFVLALSILVAGRPITYQITPNECWVCGRCFYVCPVHAIYYDEALQSLQIDQSLCNGDGNCVNSCPYGAIHQVVGNSDETAPSAQIKVRCYPNPMNQVSNLKYKIPVGKTGKIEIYNSKGQLIRIFDNLNSRQEEVSWDGKDKAGSTVSSGCYYVRLTTGSKSSVTKITKVR
jgi:Fe-S-cluster-containing hydrogenase component 2